MSEATIALLSAAASEARDKTLKVDTSAPTAEGANVTAIEVLLCIGSVGSSRSGGGRRGAVSPRSDARASTRSLRLFCSASSGVSASLVEPRLARLLPPVPKRAISI